MNTIPSGRIVIVGAGNVGTSIAYAALNQNIASEILMIDIAKELLKAQVLDLQDASTFTLSTKVSVAEYSDLIDGDIVVVTAGAAQKEGQTRLDLLEINTKITRGIIQSIKNSGKKVFIIMVTNPVDILTYIAINESGMSEGMVFGSGTYLDSGRLRKAIASDTDSNPVDVNAYIIGEHGDSSLPVLSGAKIGGIELGVKITSDYFKEVMEKVRNTAYEIIKGKGSTYLGIGCAVSNICRAIIRNEEKIFPLSVKLNGQYGISDVVMGIPVKLSRKGYEYINDLTLDFTEIDLIKKSAEIIKEYISKI